MERPIVTICCITYNHEAYVEECIDGFLKQQTSFNFEVIIHDDASTDATQKIIKNKVGSDQSFNLILRKENLKSKGVAIFPLLYKKAKGKYIAICEGDDFWNDPHKLQKQFDVMEANPDCSVCFTSSHYQYELNPAKNHVYYPNSETKKRIYELKDIIDKPGDFMTTASLFFKKKLVVDLPEWLLTAPVGDLPLSLYLASKGSIIYLPDTTCTYRLMAESSWSKSMTFAKRKRFIDLLIKMYADFNEYSNYEYERLLKRRINLILKSHKKAVIKSRMARFIPLSFIRLISPTLAKRIEYFK